MACIERRPRCGAPSSEVVPEPISEVASAVGTVAGIAGAVGGVLKALEVIGGAGAAIGAGSGGALSGLIAALVVIVIIGLYNADRCLSTNGLQECCAGVVQEIVQDFSDALEELFPFTAMHDRIDIVVKSRYWDVVEDGNAHVFCTDETPPRRSEIIRCYFFTKRVCDAAIGSLYGAGAGAVAGIILAAVAAAAIGCATVILCIFALIVAALIAAVAALVGAFVGGQIGKAASDDTSPSASDGTEIAVGDLITVNGNMIRREFDEGANVLWWVESSALSGRVTDTMPSSPFSYCELDEIFTMDGCPVVRG